MAKIVILSNEVYRIEHIEVVSRAKAVAVAANWVEAAGAMAVLWMLGDLVRCAFKRVGALSPPDLSRVVVRANADVDHAVQVAIWSDD